MKKGWLRHLDFIAVDICAIEFSLLLTQLILHEEFTRLWQLYFFLPLTQLVLAVMFNCYNGILRRGFLSEMYAALKMEFLVNAVLLFSLYFLRFMPSLPRRVLAVYLIICSLCTTCFRQLQKENLKRRYNKVKHTRQIIVIATEEAANDMIHTLTASEIRNYQLFGLAIMDRSMIGETIQDVPVSADRDSLISYLLDNVVDEAIINIPNQNASNLELIKKLLDMGITVHIYMEDAYCNLPNRSVGNVFGYNVLTTSISPISFRQALLKRFIDILGGLIGCMITALLTITIGPIIYLKSPGPIFFSQVRVGKRGRQFKIYKFRSMYMDAEQRKSELMEQNKISDGMMFKIDDDPRIIQGIGTFIRRTSLDEFPQFWNVLRGDMSMVGTRPPTMDEYSRYSPHHKRRLTMQPGITGLWQISGRSQITNFEEVVRLDTKYIENWSLDLDLKIILKTIRRVVKTDDAF